MARQVSGALVGRGGSLQRAFGGSQRSSLEVGTPGILGRAESAAVAATAASKGIRPWPGRWELTGSSLATLVRAGSQG